MKRDGDLIEIRAGKAKTASRRVIPIVANLRAWLEAHWPESGPVCPYANLSRQLAQLVRQVNEARTKEASGRAARVEAAKFVWKHNALRHSFISYRVAQTQNVAQVALEAGNSPQMIFQHYRELVRPVDAQAWFSLVPQRAGKVGPMTERETASCGAGAGA